MKSKNINWLNGDILHAEQLKEHTRYIEELVVNTSHKGIKQLIIDETSLSSQVIHIVKAELIFPDGTYVNYTQEDYSLKYQLDEAVAECRKLYLGIKGSFCTNRNLRLNSGELINLNYEEPKLVITKEHLENYIPFLEVKLYNGTYKPTNFLGPRVSVEPLINGKPNYIFEELKALNIFLRNQLNDLRDRQYIEKDPLEYTNNLMLIQGLFKAIGNLQWFITNPSSTEKLYEALYGVLSSLGWKHMSTFPLIKPFDPNNWVDICKGLIDNIYEVIGGTNKAYNSVQLELKDGFFRVSPKELRDPMLIIDPNKTEIRNWIENTQIGSSQYMEDIIHRRIKGVKRDIIESSKDLLIVKLDSTSPFFRVNEELLIKANSVSINYISLSS